MRKRTLGVLTLCILILLVLPGYFYWSSSKVQIGMTENEVEEILGGSGLQFKFRSEVELKNAARSLDMEAPPGASMKVWDRKLSSVQVLFDSNGKVAGVYYPRGSSRFICFALDCVGID